MGLFNRKSNSSSGTDLHGYVPVSGRGDAPLDLTGGSSKGEPREIRLNSRGEIDGSEWARGGVMHGLNRNADGSPETMLQHMRREAAEKEREEEVRRWGRS
ncbi:hypothetical protein [Kitasatospora sp. NPDC006786]|uniref:hypothetical protein n=1 Tax=unclassified Kitasatospora TaxID=2633591 RepID=UPI0033F2CA11